MLRGRQSPKMMQLMRSGSSGTSAVTSDNGHWHRMRMWMWMTLMWRLFTGGESSPNTYGIWPPNPSSWDHTSSEEDNNSQNKDLKEWFWRDFRRFWWFRCSEPWIPSPPLVEYGAGETDHNKTVEANERTNSDDKFLLTLIEFGWWFGAIALISYEWIWLEGF